MHDQFLKEFIKKNTGIVISDDNSYLLEDRFSSLLSEFGYKNLDELACHLQKNPFGKLHQSVIEAITTHETSFFRDSKFFESLISTFFPEIIQKRKIKRRLRIWSAACSTGQEPYSIAITLLNHFPEVYDWDISILASDISTKALDIAKAGTYRGIEIGRGVTNDLLEHFFTKKNDMWVVSDKVKKYITFEKINLLSNIPISNNFDLIFLRNILIYFDNNDKKVVVNKVGDYLEDDGLLFLGSSEINSPSDWNIQMKRSSGCDYFVKRNKEKL